MSNLFSKFVSWLKSIEPRMNKISSYLVAPSARVRYGLNDKKDDTKK